MDIVPPLDGTTITINDVYALLDNMDLTPYWDGGDRLRASCPVHGGESGNSLTVTQDGDKLLWYCHGGCDQDAVRAAIFTNGTVGNLQGIYGGSQTARPKPRPVTIHDTREAAIRVFHQGEPSHEYDYHDADGNIVATVLRYDLHDGSKTFRQISRRGDGWAAKAPETPRPLYRLPEVMDAETVYVCEGEKACDELRTIDVVATTSSGGAGNVKDSDWSVLDGKHVVIIPDNDEPGEKHLAGIQEQLAGTQARLSVVRLIDDWADIPQKGDAADWCQHFDTASTDDLRQRLDAITKDLPRSVGDSYGNPYANGANADKFQPFPLDCLPSVLRRFVTESSKAIGCDTTFSALPALAVCAAVIGTSRSLMVKRGWFVPSLIWAVIIGESGSQKTPPFRLAVKPLKDRQEQHVAEYQNDMAGFLDDIASYKRTNKRWEKTGEGERPEAPVQPVMTRCIVKDSTIEALAPILLGNPRGILVARDELAGWFTSFGQYSSGGGSADVSKWLEIYNTESITIDRKTGDQRFIYVPHPSVTICGGIQPDILTQCLTDENKSNGLQSRLLMAYPPRQPKRWRDDEVSESTLDAYHNLINELCCLKPETDISGNEKPTALRLTDDARQLFKDFVNRHGEEQNAMSGHLASQWSKLEETPARLAITLHCVRQVTDDVDDAFKVDVATMQAAITLGEWFKTECLRINRLLTESGESREANRLVDWIRSKGGRITARDLCKYRRDIPTSDDAETKLIHLASIHAGTWSSNHKSREFILTADSVGD